MLLDYVDPASVDDRTRELLADDADRFGAPSLFALALGNAPDVMAARADYHTRLVEEGPLERRLCELVYLAVAVEADCEYCIASHRRALVEQVGVPQGEVEALAAGEAAPFDDRELAAIEVGRQLADAPDGVGGEHVMALREAGFDDAEIVRLVVVAAAGLAASAIADALGIDPADRPDAR